MFEITEHLSVLHLESGNQSCIYEAPYYLALSEREWSDRGSKIGLLDMRPGIADSQRFPR